MNKKYLHFRKTYLTKFIKLLKIINKFFHIFIYRSITTLNTNIFIILKLFKKVYILRNIFKSY